METLLAVVLVIAGLAALWWRAEPLVRRALAARERELALAEQAAPSPRGWRFDGARGLWVDPATVPPPFSAPEPAANSAVTAPEEAPAPESVPAPTVPTPKRVSPALPFTFAQIVDGESEEWARDDVRGALEEAFDAVGDWHRVTAEPDTVRVVDIVPKETR